MHAIDTHAAVQRLEQAGIGKTAAEAITSLYAEAITATISDLATKSDIQAVKAHVAYVVGGANLTVALVVALLIKLL